MYIRALKYITHCAIKEYAILYNNYMSRLSPWHLFLLLLLPLLPLLPRQIHHFGRSNNVLVVSFISSCVFFLISSHLSSFIVTDSTIFICNPEFFAKAPSMNEGYAAVRLRGYVTSKILYLVSRIPCPVAYITFRISYLVFMDIGMDMDMDMDTRGSPSDVNQSRLIIYRNAWLGDLFCAFQFPFLEGFSFVLERFGL